jgi:hypothetical protein
MDKNNAKATLAAMLAGKVTKETEMMRVKTSTNIDPRQATQIIQESNLPSASELNFKQVAGSNGTLQMVEANQMTAKGYGQVDTSAIVGLLGGKKPSEIREELRSKQSQPTQQYTQTSQTLNLKEELQKRAGIGSIKLTETVLQPNQSSVSGVDAGQIVDLVENTVFDVLGSMVGVVNNNLKDRETIKQKIEEAVTFLKLTQALKK